MPLTLYHRELLLRLLDADERFYGLIWTREEVSEDYVRYRDLTSEEWDAVIEYLQDRDDFIYDGVSPLMDDALVAVIGPEFRRLRDAWDEGRDPEADPEADPSKPSSLSHLDDPQFGGEVQ